MSGASNGGPFRAGSWGYGTGADGMAVTTELVTASRSWHDCRLTEHQLACGVPLDGVIRAPAWFFLAQFQSRSPKVNPKESEAEGLDPRHRQSCSLELDCDLSRGSRVDFEVDRVWV